MKDRLKRKKMTRRADGGSSLITADPSRTGQLRAQMDAHVNLVFARLRGKVIKMITVDDIFGLKDPTTNSFLSKLFKGGAAAAVVAGGGDNCGVGKGGFQKGNTCAKGGGTAKTTSPPGDKTGTPEFKAWFSGSKVVDKNGDPKETSNIAGMESRARVVYHGTPNGAFHVFSKDHIADPQSQHFGPGFYFTEDSRAAATYAEGGHSDKASGKTPTVMQFYLKSLKPFDADKDVIHPKHLSEHSQKLLRASHVQRVLQDSDRSEALKAGRDFDAGMVTFKYTEMSDKAGAGGLGISKADIQQALIKQGYDSITVQGPGSDKNRFWIVFEPTQIKSTSNKGTFNPDDPNVLNVNPNHDAKGRFTRGTGITPAGLKVMWEYKGKQADREGMTKFLEANGSSIAHYDKINALLYSHNVQSGSANKELLDIWHGDGPETRAMHLVSQWNEWQVRHKNPDKDTDYTSARKAINKAKLDMVANPGLQWKSTSANFYSGHSVTKSPDDFHSLIDAKERGDTIFYRKGGMGGPDVMSTTTNSKGASSGASSAYFKPDSWATAEMLHKMGYRLISGARGMVGVTSAAEQEHIWIKITTTTNRFCATGVGGGVDSSCGKASPSEFTEAKRKARFKIANAPKPNREAVRKARAELKKARAGEARAGGESRGGGSKDRARQRENLFKEFGGDKKGYVVCHGCGIKTHHSADNPEGLPRFERGKIFVKAQGGGYQLPNLLPECFKCNRSRNDAIVRNGLDEYDDLEDMVVNTAWKANTTSEQLDLFTEWLREQLDSELTGKSEEQLWSEYIQQGYRKGAGRAFDDAEALKDPIGAKDIPDEVKQYWTEPLDFYRGTREDFLRSAFGRPASLDKVKLLAGRTFSELRGVTDFMSNLMGRTLADGLVQGKGAREVARDLANAVDIGRKRALVVARTELIRAHASGQLQAMREMGVEDVGVSVEWSTSGLGVTKKGNPSPCPLCAPMQGVVLTLDEAEGLIPRHPNCMCAFVPAGLGESQKSQLRTKTRIDSAVRASLKAQYRKRRIPRKPTWSPAKAISAARPKPLISPTRNRLMTMNVFCPTGKGGGVDATCSPGGVAKAPPRPFDPHPTNALREKLKGRFSELTLDKLHYLNPEVIRQIGGRPTLIVPADITKSKNSEKDVADLKAHLPDNVALITRYVTATELRARGYNVGGNKVNPPKKVDGKEFVEKTRDSMIAAKAVKVKAAVEDPETLKIVKEFLIRTANRDRSMSSSGQGRLVLMELMKPKSPVDVTSTFNRPTTERVMGAVTTAELFVEGVYSPPPDIKKFHVNVLVNDNDRAYYSGVRGPASVSHTINVATRGSHKEIAQTHVHEIGHGIERENPWIESLARDFRDVRCKDNPNPRYMSVEFPTARFDKHEKAFKDDFEKSFDSARPDIYGLYAGKDYGSPTEIISMGMEQLYRNPTHMANNDPEYFAFMIHVLKGKK